MASKTVHVDQLAILSLSNQKSYVSHPPKPRTETCSPEFPTRLYSIPVFLGSGHDMVGNFDSLAKFEFDKRSVYCSNPVS